MRRIAGNSIFIAVNDTQAIDLVVIIVRIVR